MKKGLSTGQLLDVMKPGQVALGVLESLNPVNELSYVSMGDGGSLYPCDKDGKDLNMGVILLTGSIVKDMRWSIVPQYVAFEVAMCELKKGEPVGCLLEGSVYQYTIENDQFVAERSTQLGNEYVKRMISGEAIISGTWFLGKNVHSHDDLNN